MRNVDVDVDGRAGREARRNESQFSIAHQYTRFGMGTVTWRRYGVRLGTRCGWEGDVYTVAIEDCLFAELPRMLNSLFSAEGKNENGISWWLVDKCLSSELWWGGMCLVVVTSQGWLG